MEPKVSIIIRTCNLGQFLADAIRSVQDQSFPDWETIVLDDASTDNTETVAEDLAANDLRISYVRNQTRLGRARNLNHGLSLAQGEYIAILDGDDMWNDKEKLLCQINILDRDPEIVLVAGHAAEINETAQRIVRRCAVPWHDDRRIRERLLIENIIPHSTVCYRRAHALKAGGYDESLAYTEDYEFWLRLGLLGKLCILPATFCYFRLHGNNVSIVKRKQLLRETLKVIIRYRAHYPHYVLGCLNRLVMLMASVIPSSLRHFLSSLISFQKLRLRLWDTIQLKHAPAAPSVFANSTSQNGYRIMRITDLSAITPQMQDAWNHCVVQSNAGSAFQTFRWIKTWWEHFGNDKKLFVLLAVNDKNDICALFPGMIVTQRWLPKIRRTLSFIGTPLNDIADVPHLAESVNALDLICNYIANSRFEWDMVRIKELPENSVFLHKIRSHPAFVRQHIGSTNLQLFIPQPTLENTAQKIRQLSKKHLNQEMKKLQKLGDIKITLNHGDAEKHWLFDLFCELQAKRCRQTSFSSPMQNPLLRRFWHALIDAFSNSDIVRCATLQLNKEIIAIQWHFATAMRMSLYLTTFDPTYHIYSPSLLLMRAIINSFYQSGEFAIYDFGRGDEAYKRRFAESDTKNFEFIAAPDSPLYIYYIRTLSKCKNILKKIKILVHFMRLAKKFASQSVHVLSATALRTELKNILRVIIFAGVYYSGVSWLYAKLTPQRARIICYHRIPTQPTDAHLDISLETYTRQMEYLSTNFQIVTLAKIATAIQDQRPFPARAAVVTFDDGTKDWAQNVLSILANLRIPATFFISTGFIDYGTILYSHGCTAAPAITSGDVQILKQSPWAAIGAHTHDHPRLSKLDEHKAAQEILKSKQELERQIQAPIDLFAYPFGKSEDFTTLTREILRAAGFRAACTIEERTASCHDDPYEIPRIVIFDEPLWMFKVRVSGILDDIIHIWKKYVHRERNLNNI
ncbi:MAG: GNAT family N-acetyltransferase [Patescibacteria group bacterium]